ncbi:MAG: hypothetical protein WBE26_03700 [Phycisphaerae bacterium]
MTAETDRQGSWKARVWSVSWQMALAIIAAFPSAIVLNAVYRPAPSLTYGIVESPFSRVAGMQECVVTVLTISNEGQCPLTRLKLSAEFIGPIIHWGAGSDRAIVRVDNAGPDGNATLNGDLFELPTNGRQTVTVVSMGGLASDPEVRGNEAVGIRASDVHYAIAHMGFATAASFLALIVVGYQLYSTLRRERLAWNWTRALARYAMKLRSVLNARPGVLMRKAD